MSKSIYEYNENTRLNYIHSVKDLLFAAVRNNSENKFYMSIFIV